MAHYKTVLINSKNDLKAAVKCKHPLIVVKDEQFFWEMEKSLKKNKAAKVSKNVGAAGVGVGLAGIGYFSLGILAFPPAAIFLGVSLLAGAVGLAADDLREYKMYLNYADKSIVLVKSFGKNRVHKNTDTFDGFDLKKFLADIG